MKDFLKEIPLFSTLEDPEWERLEAIVEQKTFPRDTVVIQKGQLSDELYMIHSGEVRVTLPSREGHDITLAVLGPHDFFGEMALFGKEPQPRSATVTTTRDSELLVLRGKDFAGLAAQSPGIGMKVLQGVVARLRETDEKIAGISLMDVYSELARYSDAQDSMKAVYDAKLDAAKTMFDETSKRASEIITSAERRRSATTYVTGLVTFFFVVLGALGFREFWQIQQIGEEVAKAKETIATTQGEVERAGRKAKEDAREIALTSSSLKRRAFERFQLALDQHAADRDPAALRTAVHTMQHDSGSIRPVLDELDYRLRDRASRDLASLVVVAEEASDSARDPTNRVLAEYLQVIAYLLDGREITPKMEAELDALLEDDTPLDLQYWDFPSPTVYGFSDPASPNRVRTLQERIQAAAG